VLEAVAAALLLDEAEPAHLTWLVRPDRPVDGRAAHRRHRSTWPVPPGVRRDCFDSKFKRAAALVSEPIGS